MTPEEAAEQRATRRKNGGKQKGGPSPPVAPDQKQVPVDGTSQDMVTPARKSTVSASNFDVKTPFRDQPNRLGDVEVVDGSQECGSASLGLPPHRRRG